MVCAQGLVSRKQTIARAELTAALQAARMARLAGMLPCTIVTDSTYVMRVFAEFREGFGTSGLLRSANLDLVLLLEQAWYPGIEICKVICAEALQAANLWPGNQAADSACDAALAQDLPMLHDLTAAAAEHLEVQDDRLHAVYRYYLDLDAVVQRHRSAAACLDPDVASTPDLADAGTVVAAADVQQWIRDRSRPWHGPPCRPPVCFERMSGSWGLDYCWTAWHWAQTLTWVTPAQRTACSETTTLELLCNYVVVTGTLPPMMLSGTGGAKVRVDSLSEQARLQPASVRYWLLSLTRVLQQIQKSTHWSLLPGKRSPKVYSLNCFGATYSRAGTRSCATMIYAGLTADLLQQVVARPLAQTFYSYLQKHDRPKWRRQ